MNKDNRQWKRLEIGFFYSLVVSLPFDTSEMSAEELNDQALALLVDKGIAEKGDHVILTRGDEMNAHGGTNTLKVLTII